MSVYTYRGTTGNDIANSHDLKKLYPQYSSFELYGGPGDDDLTAAIIGDTRADGLSGGEGNDLLSVFSSQSTSRAAVVATGGQGSDRFYALAYRLVSPPNFTRGDLPLTEFTLLSPLDESPLTIKVLDDVEIISYTDSSGSVAYFLTEDIARGRIRRVGWDEAYYRSSGPNSDWAMKGIDTYSAWQKKSNYTSETDAITGQRTIIMSSGTSEFSGQPGINDIFTFQVSAVPENPWKIRSFNSSEDILQIPEELMNRLPNKAFYGVSKVDIPDRQLTRSEKKSYKKQLKISRKSVKLIGKTGDSIIYNQLSGQLFLDTNGKAKGFGENGGLIAILEDKPLFGINNLDFA